MNKLDLSKIDNWMHRNARELDLALWNYVYKNEDAKYVADALSTISK